MSDEIREVEQRLKLIPFTKESNWEVWSKQFLARAHIKGYKQILLGKEISPSDSDLKELDLKTDEGKDALRLRKLNDMAYNDLLLSFSDPTNFGLIEDACVDDMENGDAMQAWKNLVNKHDPSTASNVVQMKAKFNSSRLRNARKDPDEWISNLEVLRRKLKAMGHIISEQDMMIHVINNLPEEYEAITDQLEVELDADKLDMKIIRNRVRNKYARIKRRSGKGDDGNNDENTEKALSATTKKDYKGRCFHCGKWGHKQADCKEKQEENNKSGNGNGNTQRSNNGNRNNNSGQTRKPFNGDCHYCKKPGHRISECRKRIEDEGKKKDEGEKANSATEKKSSETALCAQEVCSLVTSEDPYLWIGDSGASSHMINTLSGVTNIVDINVEVKMGNGSKCRAVKKGLFKGTVKQLDGTSSVVSFEVKYVPDLRTSLFSITAAMNNGAKLGSRNKHMTLTKADVVLEFDRSNKAGDGNTLSVLIEPTTEPSEVAMAAGEQEKIIEVDVNKFHRNLGHANLAKVKQMAKSMDIKLKGIFEECESCGLGKAKKKKIPKVSNKDTKAPMERIYIDMTTIQSMSFGNKKHWVLIVDEFTDMKWSMFLKWKSDLPKEIMSFLKARKEEGNMVQKIRLDNAGENVALKDLCKKSDDFRNVKFEFTSPRTPQQNGVAERGLATLMGRARAMMNSAGLSEKVRGRAWAECISTATYLENSMPDKQDELPPMVKYYGENYKWVKSLREFGEMAVITTRTPVVGKLENRGTTAMFVGYSNDHPADTYRFINVKTSRLLISRDYKWLNKTWGQYEEVKEKTYVDPGTYDWDDSTEGSTISFDWGDDGDNENENNEDGEDNEENNIEVEVDEIPGTRQGGTSRLEREMYRLHTFYNPTMANQDNSTEENKVDEDLPEVVAYAGAIESDVGEPVRFNDAWNHPDSNAQIKWRDAICKEIREMKNKNVWTIMSKENLEKDRKLIGNKWVFKIKKNGVYRARLVALGYSQVPGVDYTENYAPVINDVTLRTLLILMKLKNYNTRVIDVETAFLYGNLDEEIYMKIPDGLQECAGTINSNSCLKLNRSLYGRVQSARQWWKKIVEVLTKELGFSISPVDPCLLHKKNQFGMVYLCLYVDDVLCIGNQEAVDDAIKLIKTKYTIKEIGELKDYVGCTVYKKGNGVKILQPDIITKLEDNFKDYIYKMANYKTPAGPGEMVVRPREGDVLIDEEKQKLFRSGVGSLLYLMKHSRPDISNAIRELSKVMDGATKAHLKSLMRLVKYVSDTKNRGLIMKPLFKEKWLLSGKSDSDYAGDKDTRTSVSGYVVYLNGALIAWKSKSQKVVTLSSTEAEYMALCDLCTEVLFIKQLLENMGIVIDLPIKLEVDNTGALFLAENSTTSQRTKHIDVRHHFVRNLIEDKIIEVKFVKTVDNDADVYTKNVGGDLFQKHTGNYMDEKEEIK